MVRPSDRGDQRTGTRWTVCLFLWFLPWNITKGLTQEEQDDTGNRTEWGRIPIGVGARVAAVEGGCPPVMERAPIFTSVGRFCTPSESIPPVEELEHRGSQKFLSCFGVCLRQRLVTRRPTVVRRALVFAYFSPTTVGDLRNPPSSSGVCLSQRLLPWGPAVHQSQIMYDPFTVPVGVSVCGSWIGKVVHPPTLY